MSRHDHGNPLGCEPLHTGAQILVGGHIQPRKRLIEHQESRPAYPGTREQRPAQLPIGKLAQRARRERQEIEFAHGAAGRGTVGRTRRLIESDARMAA